MSHAVGSLVKCRGREWVVLPDSQDDPDLLILRPLGGTDDEVCGIYLPLEKVETASFDLPDPAAVGDHLSCRLLRDAVRLGFRASAGPFRSFGKIACEPRPYQLVPLMMALRLDPVRLLIADDVGIGKTVEACLIARELLDRGEETRLAVLCPPHLAEQWQGELKDKFHIDAELVLSSTVSRLERQCGMGQSLFDVFPFVIVSTDYIKSSKRRDEFLRTCPKLVIVDEAHSCAAAFGKRGGKHHRHELLKGLASAPDRHIILVTATPHSGIEASFRSLLSLLEERFANLPDDLSGKGNEQHRRQLAGHLVQRRRADIRSYLDADTPFPDREEKEDTYKLTPEYKTLFDKVLNYVRERVRDTQGDIPKYRQRVRWWASLALLRAIASSPAAAAATLRTKAAGLETEDEEVADELGRRSVMDMDVDEEGDITDTVPGADSSIDEDGATSSERRRLREMAKLADNLCGDKDAKLKKITTITKGLLKDGFSPIIFCRFIATAEYVAKELREKLKKVEVEWVTGLLPPEEREQRVMDLGEKKSAGSQIILVATDCLSEGVNLQAHFDAVVHYDLGWSPTRHEQRDGRVDRFGQPKKVVRSLMLYGVDNQIDGIVLEVLIRKHKTIRNSLGISVPVPANSNSVVEALFEGLLLRESQPGQMLFEEFMKSASDELHTEWENASEREKVSRTLFAQHTLKPDEVARELDEVRLTVGTAETVSRFVSTAVESYGGAVVPKKDFIQFDLRDAPRVVRDACGLEESKPQFKARFELPVEEGVFHLTRTHPLVEGLASHVMDTALDPVADSTAKRCGVVYTSAVEKRTTLLLLRLRYHIITKRKASEDTQLLAEDCRVLGFRGSPGKAEWLSEADEIDQLLHAKPARGIHKAQATDFVQKVIDEFDALRTHLDEFATERGDEILQAHRRVREATKQTGVRYEIEPQLPVDVLGIYVYLPT
jgi:superfamily II DNA or RNA helicase